MPNAPITYLWALVAQRALVAQGERLGSMRRRASRMPRGREWPRVRVPRDGLFRTRLTNLSYVTSTLGTRNGKMKDEII
ncbi:unnamed protein product [Arabidopsis thaliana]|uniref:Uncharacterized protein n=1 Tax=Arabidopsis thaliana TaxID=3702 RepID=A0A5S9WXX8_ARATH|nr:unnamed protein product [Arabidopsis thaliana]